MIKFVSLHNQTHYSILDALSTPKKLFARAKELGQEALAITDHGSLAGAWDCYKVSKETGVKLIIGCEMYFLNDLNDQSKKMSHIILIAKNAIGYKNLLTLNSKGFDNADLSNKKIYPVISWDLLKEYSEGLICLTACGNGIISQLLMNKNIDQAEQSLLKLKDIFKDNLGIEVQPNNMRRYATYYTEDIDQQYLNRQLINLGKKLDIKIVAACNSHYVLKEDAEAHDVLLAIGSHQPVFSNFRLKYNVPDFYLKSGEEVKAFFSRNYGEELAQCLCDNSVYFSDLCEQPDWIDPKYSNPSGKELPVFPVEDEPDYFDFLNWWKEQSDIVKKLDQDQAYLRYKTYKLLPTKVKNITQEYIDRIEEELDTFNYCGIDSYMLVVADYVNWSRNNGIQVGPGRGSAAGSLVAYILDIHRADSIKYGLVFPRFHNKMKKSYSDIDVDFSDKNREKVIQYLIHKYGKENVAQISNLMEITPKIYIKDVARACELGGGREEAVKLGNDISGVVSADVSSIDKALQEVPLFSEYCKRYQEFEKYKSISAKYRSFGIHASGVVITKRPLIGLIPLRKDKNGVISIEYDKDVAEETGLVKMDILGLSTLDLIDLTMDIIKNNGKTIPEDFFNPESDDPKTYDLISRGDTFGVFQLGKSGGTIDICKRIKPKNIEDLALITTLARPASKDIREAFFKTRDGKQEVAYMHPSLERAFKATYGFPLYDESLLLLAKDVAGWELGEADKLRKLTKEKGKNPEKVKKWKAEFIEGSIKNGVQEFIANRIWEEIVGPFGLYSFNKSHAVTYSMITYQTAYLKAHFPIEFLLATLITEVTKNKQDSDDTIRKIKQEIRKYKIKILPPDVNSSGLEFSIQDNKLITGLNALKFVGDGAVEEIFNKRPFNGLSDLIIRCDSHKLNSKAIQVLAAVGALDSFKIPRKLIFLYIQDYRKKLQVWLKKHDPSKEEFTYAFPKETDWSLSELYALEQFYLGEAFICKPPIAYDKFFKQNDYDIFYNVKKSNDKTKFSSLRGIVRDFFEFKVKKETSKFYGQTMVKATIEDKNGDQISCTIFPERWQILQDKLKMFNKKAVFENGLAMHFSGISNSYEDDMGIIFDQIYSFALPPALPQDLKAKKINLKEKKEEKQANSMVELQENIEDSLYNEGLVDLDEEDD